MALVIKSLLTIADINRLQQFASQVRRDILRMTHVASSGHPGGSLGCTEYLVALYQEVMNYKTKYSLVARPSAAMSLVLKANVIGCPLVFF